MKNRIKNSISIGYTAVCDYFYFKIVRPIRKYFKRKAFESKRESIQLAKGELVEQLEPLLLRLLSESLSDYRNYVQPQNHFTVQACHDIRKLYEIKIKSFINSKN